MEDNEGVTKLPLENQPTEPVRQRSSAATMSRSGRRRMRIPKVGPREIIFFLLILGVVFGSGTAASSIFGRYKGYVWHAVEYAWIAYIVINLLIDITSGTLQKHWHFYRKITVSIVAQSIGAIFVVLIVAGLLYRTMPFLDRSWIYVLQPKYHVVKTQQVTVAGHATTVYRKEPTKSQAQNVITLPFKYGFVGITFGVVLLMALPLFAYEEEMMFRVGTHNWKQGCRRSLVFGLMHCIVGVPIFVGLALGVGGLWFTLQYFKGGVERSTTYHLAYNATIFVSFMCYLLFTLLHHPVPPLPAKH